MNRIVQTCLNPPFYCFHAVLYGKSPELCIHGVRFQGAFLRMDFSTQCVSIQKVFARTTRTLLFVAFYTTVRVYGTIVL